MKKTLILQLSLCLALCLTFACKQDTTVEDSTPSSSSHDAPVKKIQKKVLSDTELAKLTRYQDKATGKFGYKNDKGEVLTKPVYDAAMSYRETDLARVSNGKKFGFVGLDGSEVIPLKYDDAGIFTSEGLAAVKLGQKWGYIDRSGKMVVEPDYNFTLRFYEGMSSVQRDGKWGYINTSGEEVIPVEYEATGYFNNGLASVRKNGKWGYIDKTNKVVVPFDYQRADPMGMSIENAGRVTKDGVTFYINKQGKCIMDCPKK